MNEVLINALVLAGTTFILLGAIGAVRLPDVFCQGHAVAKGATLGILLILLALGVSLGVEAAGFKVFFAMVFQFATVPVGSHLVSRLAWEKGIPRWRMRPIDQGQEVTGGGSPRDPVLGDG